MSTFLVRNKLSKTVLSLSLDKEELRKLLSILQTGANFAGELEYQKHIKLGSEKLDLIKANIEKSSILYITLIGTQNEELFGNIDEVFNSQSFPEDIKSILLNSELIYRADFKYYPDNQFSLTLDFSKPKIFDFSLDPGDRTPNNSNFEVQGGDNTWVNGVFHEVNSYIANKASKNSKVHNGSTYSFLLWLIGMPLGFGLLIKL